MSNTSAGLIGYMTMIRSLVAMQRLSLNTSTGFITAEVNELAHIVRKNCAIKFPELTVSECVLIIDLCEYVQRDLARIAGDNYAELSQALAYVCKQTQDAKTRIQMNRSNHS